MTRLSIFRPNRFLLLLALFFLGSSSVWAQSEPQFESLLVEVWPEFDRPETLVIYRGRLSNDTPLPATISFLLPGYIKDMNAVAYADGDTLMTVPSEMIEQTYLGNQLRLTFETASTTIQIEYYDPQILSRQGDKRTLNYSFTAPYPIKTTTFEFQEPLRADNFAIEPAATETFTDGNGLTYNIYNVANFATGDSASFRLSYRRFTDQPSVNFLTSDTPTESAQNAIPALPLTTTPPATTDTNQILGYVLAGVGTCLFIGAGALWWLDRRRHRPKQHHPPERLPQTELQSSDPVAMPQSRPSGAEFCYKCGAPLRPEANFCHDCGSPRRA